MKRFNSATVSARKWPLAAFVMVFGAGLMVWAQPLDAPPPGNGPDFGGPPPFGLGGGGPPMGPWGGPPGGGPGGMEQPKVELVKKHDKNNDGWLNQQERQTARAALAQSNTNRRMGGPGGRRGGFGRSDANAEPSKAGARVTPAAVKAYADAPFYASNVLRTIFLEFENADWEKELEDFHGTDVDVPARMMVDGKAYANVGVRFRGASSYFMLGSGEKRSLNLSVDMANSEQRVGGYRTLNLLNSHEDPTFMRTVLYFDIARNYLAAPKANWVQVVINGEIWGVYVNVQQFNKDFIKEWFGTTKGARWKVPGSPRGRGGLSYLGEDVAAYKSIYEIKTKDDFKSWSTLIQLCKVLSDTPTDKLEAALTPLLDIDGALKFLALENALVNNDGYWTRASDYDLYLDEQGRFHIIPYDANETFALPGGPGFGGPGFGSRGGGFGGRQAAATANLDPLCALQDTSKPLLSKLLAVPALRKRYLEYVRDIASKWLDWQQLGPLTTQYQQLLGEAVRADTRNRTTWQEFQNGITGVMVDQAARRPGSNIAISLKQFAAQRRAYLMQYAPPAQSASR